MKKKKISRRMIRENFQLFTLTLPVVVLLAIFNYWPMFGAVLAFKDYKVTRGIFGSEWMKPLFKHFDFFIKSKDAFVITRNTILLNLLFIAGCTICAVVFALLMFEVKKAHHIKIYQTVSILPSFLSWVAVSYIVYGLLETDKGIINRIIVWLGGEKIAWYITPEVWPVILLLVRIWHGIGLKSIIYYASLMGVDDEIYEAAEVDGANKLQRALHISIPHLVSIVTILVILDIGGIFRADFGLFYNVTRNVGALYPTTDVMDTYIFRALTQRGDIGLSSAAALIQSIVCFATIMVTNTIVRKVSPENALF